MNVSSAAASAVSKTSITDPMSQLLLGLAPRELDSVLRGAARRQFRANSVVIRQGDPASHLFLLTRGRARYFFVTPEGRRILLRWLAPGDVFGAIAILSRPAFYLVGTEVLKEGEALAWDRPMIRSLAMQHPKLMDNALSIAADYVQWDLELHSTLSGGSARQKLASLLLRLAHEIGQRVSGGIEVEVTNEDLAAASNLTLFTVSRLLSALQKKGVLVKSRGKVVLFAERSSVPNFNDLL
jgi:CRP-like cAMP-binding protein